MLNNGLQNRHPALKKGFSYSSYPSVPPVERASRTGFGFLLRWGFTLFFGAWMFVIGIIVGRVTTPAKFQTDPVKSELARLKKAEMEKDEALVRQVTETLRHKDWPFFEALATGDSGHRPGPLVPRQVKPPVVKRALTRKNPQEIKSERVVTEAVEPEPEVRSVRNAPPVVTVTRRPPEPEAAPALPVGATPVEKGVQNYAIQVASYVLSEDADRLVGQLRAKGYTGVYRAEEAVDGIGVRYRVKVGYFTTRASAWTTLSRLKKREKLNGAYIFRRK
ncbi:hypothetical protein DENIS_3862 [Desulfonema ishimotonii]|uniref:SPOR domain-containing protein n=1 Tax=Desulfonema ishimotonii TaxID=45657 RepID=A0A401G0W8_9BACT|nr:SPOR domain-containing protein [Desulfonema ishimotonii]GBC62878.1 hypothetical protein DENIS_3862 [Desulfonema ishimotonii]